mmetsp:Transcript_6406/g.12661  ORF Transcript_6406/g.12661 Transcript_6406/m.12661 type:complete len:300 (+) Transcript_6406:3-902(+)
MLISDVETRNEELIEERIRHCLLLLSEVGELLNTSFPWTLPSTGISTLPRLYGRARVTFSITRPLTNLPLSTPILSSIIPPNSKPLGNITIIADGFTAPLTAGNFVDLANRGFYTGLPIRDRYKRCEGVGGNVLMMGSFNDGFNDPFTAKLRTVPIEIVDENRKIWYGTGLRSPQPPQPPPCQIPLVSLQSPGVVAMNHPVGRKNLGSSEFFFLPPSTSPTLGPAMDGNYAPFGYIVEGWDTAITLRAGDVIEQTTVDDWGLANLVQGKQIAFKEFSLSSPLEVLFGDSPASDDADTTP